MISTGTMVAYWIDFGFRYVSERRFRATNGILKHGSSRSYLDNSASWRVPIALQCFFAVFLIALVLVLPESPRWLVSKQRFDEAQKVIAALEPAPFDSPAVIAQLRTINDALDGQTRQRKRDLGTNGPGQHARRMLLGASSQLFQQVGGGA